MERNRINFAKLQLLRYVDFQFVQLRVLASPDIEEAMNMPNHGLERQELVILLYQMFDDHFLVAQSVDRGLFTPTLEEIQNALNEEPDFILNSSNTFYAMTSGASELYKELKDFFRGTHET